MRILRFDQLTLTPWKNGGGTTRELLCFPEGAGTDRFDYRISLATISRDGPFSSFPGVDRTLALVEGEGVTLHVGADQRVVINEDTPVFQFPGELPVHAVVNAGTTMDFNVMTRRGHCRHQFRIHYGELLPFECEADLTLVFCADIDFGLHAPGPVRQFDSMVAGPGETVGVSCYSGCFFIVDINLEDGVL
ncbi:HutD family protein [Massilia sp. TS11]|uniref:HutD/Ves family protein n=1 Tax=Massilia sp. TS11 TaxID=2908003 RepID=UPI001EDA93E6|nr:HutD family protein [Massilia sp. TS11]MCG2586280.1 HutD family protein [Massilia sp. TS11]